MRRIVLAFVRSVGRSVSMLKALSLEARTRGKDRRRKLSPRLCLSLSFLFSCPANDLARSSYHPTFLQRAIVFRHSRTLYIP